jgi:membrane-associated phospholipid phosphatase
MVQGSSRVGAGPALLGGGLLFLLVFLTLTAVVTQQRFDGLDHSARSWVHQSREPALQPFMEAASFLGGRPGQVVVVVMGTAVLWPHRRRWALALPLVMGGVGLVQLLAKWSVDRPRPNLVSWGFPSAHVLSLVVLCGYLVYVLTRTSASSRSRYLAAGAGLAVVGTVAYSRMYLDAHWLSDLLGGFTGGLAYLLLAIWLVEWGPRIRSLLQSAPQEIAAATDCPLAPAAGPAVDSLIATAAVVAMAPATPIAETR